MQYLTAAIIPLIHINKTQMQTSCRHRHYYKPFF